MITTPLYRIWHCSVRIRRQRYEIHLGEVAAEVGGDYPEG